MKRERILAIMRALATVPMLSDQAVCGAGTRQQEERNKNLVLDFYDQAINRKDFEAAAKFLGPKYIRHNQNAVDGAEGLKGFRRFLRETCPDSHREIKRVFAEGNFVILHVHAVREPGTRGMAVMDIFRLQEGRIVEHGNVHDAILEKAANANGMF